MSSLGIVRIGICVIDPLLPLTRHLSESGDVCVEILPRDAGTPTMLEHSRHIHSGALAYLRQQYRRLGGKGSANHKAAVVGDTVG